MDVSFKSHFESAGVFVLRAPLLPADGILGDAALHPHPGSTARRSSSEPIDLPSAMGRLAGFLDRPEVSAAIKVASPVFFSNYVKPRRSDIKRRKRMRQTLTFAKFVIRMSSRSTPFGAFAGPLVGTIGDETRLTVPGVPDARLWLDLDSGYLSCLQEALAANPVWCRGQRVRVNPTIYRVGERWRYYTPVDADTDGQFHLAEVEAAEHLDHVIDCCRTAVDFTTVAESVAGLGFDRRDADEYILELLRERLLVGDIHVSALSGHYATALQRVIDRIEPTSPEATALGRVVARMESLPQVTLGDSHEVTEAIERDLRAILPSFDGKAVVNGRLVRNRGRAPQLGKGIVGIVLDAVDALWRFESARPDPLRDFKQAFQERYGGRWLPLLEALDDEIGIGFADSDGSPMVFAPLLRDIPFPNVNGDESAFEAPQRMLMRAAWEAQRSRTREVVLSPDDLPNPPKLDPLRLPDSMSVLFSICDRAVEGAEVFIKWVVPGCSGPHGRFCHGDDALSEVVQDLVRREEALHPDAIVAEVDFTPPARAGNVVTRPLFRDWVIPINGTVDGVDGAREIPLDDLLVSVQDDAVVLCSMRMATRVIPRITNMHGASNRGQLPIYRFLHQVQRDSGPTPRGVPWGPLTALPFLPRLVVGRAILSAARWMLEKEDFASSDKAEQTFDELPRFVNLTEGDNFLTLDLQDPLSREILATAARKRDRVSVAETIPNPLQGGCTGDEGCYAHECVLPLVRRDGAVSARRIECPAVSSIQRNFAPASEWVYFKLYGGPVTLDKVVCGTLQRIVDWAERSEIISTWFFIRYGDPDHHLRVRFRLRNRTDFGHLVEHVRTSLLGDLDVGRVRKIELGTYEREIERYGSDQAIEIVEKIFEGDSRLVIQLLTAAMAENQDRRHWLAFSSAITLLEDLGCDIPDALELVKTCTAFYGRRFRSDRPQFRKALAARIRRDRATVTGYLNRDVEVLGTQAWHAIQQRTVQIRPFVAALRRIAESGVRHADPRLLAQSLLHMHLNRLFAALPNENEFVVYDRLVRHYQSLLSRSEER